MCFESDLKTVLCSFPEVSDQLQLSRAVAPGQKRLWNESEVTRETESHDGKKPGEFAPHDSLKQAAIKWMGDSSTMALHLADISSGTSGSGVNRQLAEHLHAAVQNAPLNKVTLYRGDHQSPTGHQSWTSRKSVAEGWAKRGGGKVWEIPPGSMPALPLKGLIPNDAEKQFIVNHQPKPKTPAGQNLLFDSGVKDHPVVKPAPQPSTLEKIADEQAKTKVSPIDGQKELFSAGLEPVHHHVGKRFGIPPEAVKSLMESGVPELRRRDQWLAESNGTSPQTGFETFPHGTARINQFGDPNESYVDYMTEFSPHEIEPTEPEDGIKKSQTYKDYVQWAKAGHQPPPVSVFSSNNGNGKLLTSSRRRTLAAREAGVEKIPAWHGPYNPETGNPLKYGDVMKAVNEFHSQQFSRTLGEITPVEFSTAAPPRKRRVIDEKRTREDVEEDEKVFGKKKRIPTDGDRPETGWTKVGGSTVHVDDDGVIDKGCPGLKGEAVEDLIDESDESRERREARQAYARAAGITGDQITAAQAKSMGSDAHVEGMKQAKEIAEADPRPTIGTSDVLRGVDDQTGEPAVNGHELLQSNNREHPESNEQFEETGMPSPMKFMPDEDEGNRPQWMGPKLSEMVPIPPRPKFLRDREPLNHDEAATYQPQIDKLESDIAKWRDARDAMKKGRDISQFGLAPDQKTPEYADAQIKALQGPLGKLKRQLSDYLMRSTPNQNPATQTWTSLDSAAEGAAAKFGIPIHHIVEAMPDAYLFRLAQSIEHESLKKAARQKLQMHAGDLARIENQHSDWSDVPRFDEASREFASENPGAGLDPYAHDTPDKVWSLVREGVTAMPAKDSPEIAELAAQMISGDYNRKPLEFNSDDDFADDWGQEEHGDTSFDPNSFSRSLMSIAPVEFARVKPARNQSAFNWDESAHPREESVHDGKRPGEFAPSQGVASPQQSVDPETDYKQNGTRSKAFKAWFGDWEHDPANSSKVVDAEGEPQETASIPGEGSKVMKDGKPIGVYHGTGKGGWDKFDKAFISRATSGSDPDLLLYGPGFYFTEDPDVAADYAKIGSKDVYETKASRQELIDIASRSQAALNDEFQLWKNAGMEGDAGHIKHAIGHLENLKSLAKIEKASFESNQDVLRALKSYALMAESPSDPDQAPAKTGHEAIVKRDSGEVKNVYLNIRKPFDIDGKTPVGDIAGLKRAFGEKLGGKIASAYGYTMTGDYGNWSVDNSIVYSAAAELYGGKSAANDNLAKMGFDGITHIGGDRMGGGHHHRVWIAFEPNQIKAVNNRGTFNPEDDRLEFSRPDELETIAERMGIDADSLRAAIAAMPGPKSESLIWIRKLMHDPSRGVLRDRSGHVVGFLTRNGQKIQLRDSRGRQSGTVTGSSFRDSKGRVTGTLQEFSQQLQEIEPVEFARIKPAPGQMSLFDEGKVNRETTQHENKRPGEFAPKTEPATTPKPQYQPSTPGATVTHGYAGMREGFAIKTPHGAEVNGYTHNADFPGKKSDEKRGELFITTVPKHMRLQGLGSSLAKDALGLMKHHGAERVGISTTSDEGRAMVSSLLRDGHIHGPLSTSQTGKSEYGIGAAPATLPSTVDFPQTNSFEAMKGVHVRRENGVTHFSHPEHKWGLTKVPTSQENRFLDEINGRLSHPANSGHPTLDRVLSGQGKYLGKGHEALVHDAGNGMVVKSAVITPFHINNGTRTPEEANRIIGDTVNLSRELRRRGVPGILPQYGVFHDGRQFAVQPKVDANPKLTDEHIKQLEETLHAVHDAGYVLRDQIQPGLDHNGRASLFDIGSAEKLKGTNQHWDDDDKRSDFNNLQHLANKHGLKYQTPQQRQWDNDYDNLLSRVTNPRSGKEITDPKEAGKIRAQLVTYNRLMKAKDPDMHELYTDHHEAAMKRLNEISPLVRKTINADGTVQFGQLAFEWDEDEHPRDEAGRFKDKLHHQIKEYLSDGSRRHLRDIHDHTGHKDYDALDPLSNKANAALKELRDSGQISGASPSIGEPHFYMTESQIAAHRNPESVKEKDTDISYKKPVGEEVSSKDELKSKDVGRTRNAIHFDPAIVGPSGATLTSYDWRFEWIVDDEKSDDPIRVSDWNESERNEHTKRQVVHVFHVTDPDGDQHFVSLETAVKLLGLVKKSEDLNKVKSLAQAAIKLAQAKQEHEKLLNDESQKSRYEYKFKVQSSEENIKDLQSKMEFLNSEAAMIGAGKSPVDHYREVARKLQSLIKLYRSDKHGTSQQDRVTEFVKAKGGASDQQKERRIEGYGHYKKLIAANGMNVLGERKSTTPNVDGEPEKKIFGRTVPAEPAWSDQKMRLWYAKHGKNAEAAIADSHKWLAEHHPDYSILLEHPDFKSLRGEQEFSRLLDITPVEFGRKPAPGQKGFDFDAPATEPIADKAAENEPTKQSSLFADIPAEHLDEAKKLSELHGGREVKKTKTGWQVRAPKDGKVSEVNGEFYKGGRFMPIHGLTEKKEPQPKRQKPAIPFTPPKPNEDGREREPRSPMSPEQIEELRKQREDEKAWGDIQRTPLGRLLELGDKPKYKQGTIPITDLWREYAERVGPAAMLEMKDQFEKEVHAKIDKEWQDAIDEQSGLTDEQIMRRHGLSSVRRFSPDDAEWDKNQLKESAHNSATEWKPRTGKAVEKSVPGTHYVRELIGHILSTDNGLPIGEMKRIGDILASHESASRSEMADPVEAKKNGYYPNKFPGTTASGKKVKAGDGWVKKSQQTGKYETYTDDDVKSAIQQFSRDLEICLQEFARHEFSSTQFNIRGAGYPRSQGSPLDALVKLAKSIPTEELHEGERSSRDDMHITVKYGLHTDNADEVAKIVRGFGPVTVKLGKTSIFPANEKKSYDVVKVAVTGSDIHRLNKLISASTECTDTWPDFKPHLTIAYVMPGFGKKYAGLDTFEGMELTFDSLQFSNKDREKTEISLVDKTEEFSRLDWIENRMEFEFARRRPDGNQNSFGWSDEEQETPVQSSNVHSFAWEGPPATGNLLVRFKNRAGGAGPMYRYHGTPHALYDGMAKAASKGKFVWDELRVRGTVSGHQFPYSLIHTGDTAYVPRQAGLRRGYTGEHFLKRTLNGVESQLAPAPVKKGPARRIPGYDPNKLKFPGEQQQTTVQSQTSSGPAPSPVNSPKPMTPTQPAQPQTPAAQNPQAPPSTPPNKTKGLIDKVLDFFKRKRKKPDDPKQFSREEWDAYESLVKSGFV